VFRPEPVYHCALRRGVFLGLAGRSRKQGGRLMTARVTLVLAFTVAAGAIVFPRLFEYLHLEQGRFLQLILYIPAVVIGAQSWLRTPSYARFWAVIGCVLMVWIGLTYAGDTESKRGFLIAAYLTIPLPIAALIVQKRAWWLCAKTFVYASTAMLVLAIWLEYRAYNGAIIGSLARFGYLMSESKDACYANPNRMGGQLAIAAVMALVLYLRGLRPASRFASAGDRPGIGLGWTIALSLGCILTASRGAFVAWFAGVGLLILLGTRGLPANRLRDLLGVSGLIVATGLFLSTALELTPWGRLQDRLVGEDSGSLSTFGSRLTIWQNAFDAWLSTPDYTWFGTGTGVAELLLGSYEEESAFLDSYGNNFRSAHSVYIEWLLSFGAVGLVLAGCALISMVCKARQMDLRERGVDRQAILLTVLLFAGTAVLYRHNCWMAPAALILSMLSEIRPARAKAAVRPSAMPRPVLLAARPPQQSATCKPQVPGSPG
jgi:O-antigen ligase